MQSYIQWKKTYELIIDNPPDTDGYQCTFILEYIQGMNSDFSDVRFSTVDRDPIPYYLESISIFEACRVWLALPANETKIIMYVGNGAVKSESDQYAVFDFYAGFTTFDRSVWNLESGSAKIDNGALVVENSSVYSAVTTKEMFPVNSLVEIRAHRESGNVSYIGFRNSSTLKAAVWSGSSSGTNNDQMMTSSGSAANYVNDGVDRSGKVFFTYGVAHLTAGDKFYVNYVLRGTASSLLPGNVSLPIQINSDPSKSVYVDWVRVRKYATVEPTISIGKRQLLQTAGYLFNESKFYHVDTVAVFLTDTVHKYINNFLPVNAKLETYLGNPISITNTTPVYVSVVPGEIKRYEELGDYSLDTCDISRATSDVYTQLSADFYNDIVPSEGTTITHIVQDSKYVMHTLFSGKVLTKNPKLSYLGTTVSIEATDIARNLSTQPIPWNYQVISLDSVHTKFSQWIIELLDSTHTGIILGNVIDTNMPDKQFVFNPNTTRWEAIQKIADYMGCIAYVKLLEKYDISTDRINSYSALYVVPVKDIDQRYGGFDLPGPIELTWPDNSIVDSPSVPGQSDTQYNSVMVYGVLSSTGETVVAIACTPKVSSGETWANTYTLEDNNIYEKGSSAENEAIKWLLYFTTQKSSVQVKFVDRYDIELYQRIRFGQGFSDKLQDLTRMKQQTYVAVYDPRDEFHSKRLAMVSGVPTPAWLRVDEIKYHSENVNNYCEVKLVTDYIYSSVDPVVPAPYDKLLAPGYYKPTSDDSVTNTQTIVENTISKQQTSYETGTLLSIDAVAKTGIIQTTSGKLLKVSLPWL